MALASTTPMYPKVRRSDRSTMRSWSRRTTSTRSTARSNRAAWSTGPTRALVGLARSTPTTAAAGSTSATPEATSWRFSPGPTARAARHTLRCGGRGACFPGRDSRRPSDRRGPARLRSPRRPASFLPAPSACWPAAPASGPSIERNTSAMLISVPGRANSYPPSRPRWLRTRRSVRRSDRMSTRNCGGMPWAFAKSSVLTRTPPSTVASWTIARTAYSALADMRMDTILPPTPDDDAGRGPARGGVGQCLNVKSRGGSAGDLQHRVGVFGPAHHQVGQQRIGPVVLQWRTVDTRRVQTGRASNRDRGSRVPLVLPAGVHVHVGQTLNHRGDLRAGRSHLDERPVQLVADLQRNRGWSGARDDDAGRPGGCRRRRGIWCCQRDALRRQGNRAGDQIAGLPQRDVDGPVLPPEFGELPGAVQRVDDPYPLRAQPHRVIGAFFGQHGIGRAFAFQRLHQVVVGSLVPRCFSLGLGGIGQLVAHREQ